MEVFRLGRASEEHRIGRAEIVSVNPASSPWHAYGFAFVDAAEDWFLMLDENSD